MFINSVKFLQLCLALADLALQMSSWQKPVIDLINRFGGNTTNLWPLLEIMTVLPEEVNSRSLRYSATSCCYRSRFFVATSKLSNSKFGWIH